MRISILISSLGLIGLNACSVGRDAPAPIDYGVPARSQSELERDAQHLKDLEEDLAAHGVVLTAQGWDEKVFATYVESHADQKAQTLSSRLSTFVAASSAYESNYASFAMDDHLYTVDNLKVIHGRALAAQGLLERVREFPNQSIAVGLYPTFTMDQFRQELEVRSKQVKALQESGFELITHGSGAKIEVEIKQVPEKMRSQAEIDTASLHLAKLRALDVAWVKRFGQYPMTWVRDDGELLMIDQKTYEELGLDAAKALRQQTVLAIDETLEKLRKGPS